MNQAASRYAVIWVSAKTRRSISTGTVFADFPGLFHRSWESALRSLSYFDTMNMADRITCPVFLGLGRQDPVCPPATVLAVYSRLDVPKSHRVYPDAGRWVDPAHQAEKRAWLLRHLGVISEM